MTSGMHDESIVRALLGIVSGMFEGMSRQSQRKAAMLIQDGAGLIHDADAKRLMGTFCVGGTQPRKRRQSSKQPVLAVTVPPDLRDDIAAAAEARSMTRSDFIRVSLISAVRISRSQQGRSLAALIRRGCPEAARAA